MSQIVLIVDDDITSLKLAMNIVEKDYRVATAVSGAMALKYLEKNRPDLILLDLNMPEMDGLEVMEILSANPEYSSIPVIFLTATHSPQVEAQCLDVGALDFVSKPFIPQVLRSRVRRILELHDYKDHLESMVEESSRKIADRTRRKSDLHNAIIVGLVNLIEERDSIIVRDLKIVQTYVGMICDVLKDNELYKNILTDEYKEILVTTSPLFDVGKMKIPDAILQKNGVLDEEEFKILHSHTRIGADILDDMLRGLLEEDHLKAACDMALYHHERWDGAGFPEGLSGESIPLSARIIAVAIALNKLCVDYLSRDDEHAIDDMFTVMKEYAGTQLDPDIVSAFLTLRDKLEKTMKKEGAI